MYTLTIVLFKVIVQAPVPGKQMYIKDWMPLIED